MTSNSERYEEVVRLLNEASTNARNPEEKLKHLRKVEEIIINEDSNLLDNFLDEVIGFQNDADVDLRKFIVVFIQKACRKDPDVLSKVAANVSLFLKDENVQVQKKTIIAATEMYQLALRWVTKTRNVTEMMETTWEYFVGIKNRIIPLVDSENDGIRTYAIKFLEACVLLQSCKPSDSVELKPAEIMSLDQVPRDHRFISYRKLESEGRTMFQRLLDLIGSSSISSINLLVSMGAVVNVAKRRPDFMEKVISGLEALQGNLPPTLAKSQVSSVRKELKKYLLKMFQIPKALDFMSQITSLLTSLGATDAELKKFVPAALEARKRKKEEEGDDADDAAKKRAKIDDDDDADEMDDVEDQNATAVDITAEYLRTRLVPKTVADLVLLNMVTLPDTMPAHFQSSYTSIDAAGTDAQIRQLCRMFAAQLTSQGLGPGVEQVKAQKEKGQLSGAGTSFALADAAEDKKEIESKIKQPVVLQPSGVQASKGAKRLHQFGLVHITKPMSPDELHKMSMIAFERVLNAEKRVKQGGAGLAHVKILISLASQFNTSKFEELLESFIMVDKARADLAILWVYQAYASFQGFNSSLTQDSEKGFENYDRCLTRLLSAVCTKGDHKESLFHRLLLEAPNITPSAIEILKLSCTDSVQGKYSLDTLKLMILTRPRQRGELLFALLDFTSFENADIRNQSLEMVKELYLNDTTRESVINHMTIFLRLLLNPTPPNSLFGVDRGRPRRWDDDSIKACLYLYLHLLPINHKLVHELAQVYVDTAGDIKRVILRQMELPVKAMGMHSPELLLLVETCPRGAETLVTRIVHLLTEKVAPSQELVRRIRELYQRRVPDVRFLIPVLSGLTKREIVAALPKLIKLNPNIVKEVFNRLLHGGEGSVQPLSPSELLMALHNMEVNLTDMKAVIQATNLLLAERHIYTHELLAGVIQQLVDMSPLPILLMRTVIQALNLYPRLIGFVMNILQRLIMKQVWKQPRVWEGFIKCCQRTKPQSFQVLLQLPPTQLKSVFMLLPELRSPLLEHINSLSAHQQAHIPPSMMKVLQTDPSEYGDSHPSETTEAGEAETSENVSEGEEQIYSEEFAHDTAALESSIASASTAEDPTAPMES